jgi:hypothetical protein
VVSTRVLKRANGTRQVQIVWGKVAGKRKVEYVGSGRTDDEIELLLVEARERINAGQGVLDLGLDDEPRPAGAPLKAAGSSMATLWDALNTAYRALGLGDAAGGDDVFRDLVLARVIEPTSKKAAIERVLPEIEVPHTSVRTMTRRLRLYSAEGFREALAAACAASARLGPASLVMFDVTNLWFETDEGDDFRVPGYSKERRVEPLIQIGLLTDGTGLPLMISSYEGNTAETKMMIPTLKAFMATHHLGDVVVVADAWMISEANWKAIEAEGLSFILGAKIPHLPYVIDRWQQLHPDTEFEDGQTWVAREPVGTGKKNRADHVAIYQWKAKRAARTLRGIDKQLAKAEAHVAGKDTIKRNRFIKISGVTKSINRELEAKARSLAGLKAYLTNMPDPTPATVIGAYQNLFKIEKTFRMAKSDLAVRPVFHRLRESIDAHLNIVFAALAVSHWIETTTGWTIKRFVTTPAATARPGSSSARSCCPRSRTSPTTSSRPSTRSTPPRADDEAARPTPPLPLRSWSRPAPTQSGSSYAS